MKKKLSNKLISQLLISLPPFHFYDLVEDISRIIDINETDYGTKQKTKEYIEAWDTVIGNMFVYRLITFKALITFLELNKVHFYVIANAVNGQYYEIGYKSFMLRAPSDLAFILRSTNSSKFDLIANEIQKLIFNCKEVERYDNAKDPAREIMTEEIRTQIRDSDYDAKVKMSLQYMMRSCQYEQDVSKKQFETRLQLTKLHKMFEQNSDIQELLSYLKDKVKRYEKYRTNLKKLLDLLRPLLTLPNVTPAVVIDKMVKFQNDIIAKEDH